VILSAYRRRLAIAAIAPALYTLGGSHHLKEEPMFTCMLATCLLLGGDTDALGQEPTLQVGRVIIVGNTTTPDDVIRKHLLVMPGRPTNVAILQLSQRLLRLSGRFEMNAQRGSPPTIYAVAVTDELHVFDILVQVQEKRLLPK
jgi:Surface antigen variable number repeat